MKKTLGQLVADLGGGRHIASLMRVNESSLSRWAHGLAIPRKHRKTLAMLAGVTETEIVESQIHFLRLQKGTG